MINIEVIDNPKKETPCDNCKAPHHFVLHRITVNGKGFQLCGLCKDRLKAAL